MSNEYPWFYPWNVGEDPPNKGKDVMLGGNNGANALGNALAQLMKGGNGGGAGFIPQQMAQQQYAPPAMHPQMVQAMQNCPPCPQGMDPMQWLQQWLAGGIPVHVAQRGAFNPQQYYNQVPRKQRTEDLPLGNTGLVAVGATGTLSAVVQKPFAGDKLVLAPSFQLDSWSIVSIVAAGQTVTAAAGEIPATAYANVDSFGNLGLPALTAGASIVITARNLGLTSPPQDLTLYGSIRGFTGEG